MTAKADDKNLGPRKQIIYEKNNGKEKANHDEEVNEEKGDQSEEEFQSDLGYISP